MNQPTPAIVAQAAVRRLPRIALLLLCVAYVVPGFIGREPWKNQDITAFGYMFELAHHAAPWFSPQLLGQPPEFDALLPYWLGAWAIQAAPAWIPADFAARIPFALLLALTFAATWYAVYSLARSPRAQPVPFAFGGEANPADYARALADGGLLALIATLGLAQLSHETTPALAQVCFTALTFLGIAALTRRTAAASAFLLAGVLGLVLSGAPSMAMLFTAGGLIVTTVDPGESLGGDVSRRGPALAILAVALACGALVATWLGLWHWRMQATGLADDARALGRLLLWFTWPLWPLALWTLWRWRLQLASRHVALPLWFALVAIGTTLLTPSSDRSLLLALPAIATLAAFALPTFSRSASALIDWFALLFFSGGAIVVWVIWLSMQTGMPPQPAANIARLAPGFEPSFSAVAFGAALAATIAWFWLVRWRTGRHRSVLWKSMVLPAGGAALGWLLVMTLWLPVLDYARSYAPVARGVAKLVNEPGCVEAFGLGRAQAAAFRFHAGMDLRNAAREPACPWLVAAYAYQPAMSIALDMKQWQPVGSVSPVRRPADPTDNVLVYRRAPKAAPQ